MNRELENWQTRCVGELGVAEDASQDGERPVWRRRLMAIAEVAGGVAMLAMLAAFCWLCCAASGYHWE